MKYPRCILKVLIMGAFLFTACGGPSQADLVLRGGKVATVDEAFSIAEAVAVAGDKIIFVGSSIEADKYIGEGTRIIELEGRLVLPGLIDAHGHFQSLGASLKNLNFVGTTSFSQITGIFAEKVREAAAGEWVLGRSWDQNDWDVKNFPTHDALSSISPDNPVWLVRIDGHAGLANKKALELAGITKNTPDPPGGKIHRKSSGEPTGVFIDNAMELVESKIPELSVERFRETFRLAAESCLAAGLTGMHDMGAGSREIEAYKFLIDNGQLDMRIYAYMNDPGDADPAEYMRINRIDGYGNNFLTVRGVKLYIDGALGSRGAAMMNPYADDPGNNGLLVSEPEHIFTISRIALENNMQVTTHAIGDQGNKIVLDAYEKALGAHPAEDHRFRIEHAQIMDPRDIPRLGTLGVLPSMQPTHATSDMYWCADRISQNRLRGAYAWRAFMDAGSIIPAGSDFPVESNNPMLGIYAAITRQDAQGWPEGGWLPEQRMTREEVIRGFTIWAAYAAFQEDILGSIEKGKLADFVVLDKDILEVEPKEILTTKPVYTIVGGTIRFSAQER